MPSDIRRLLVRVFQDYDVLSTNAAADLIRDWFAARRSALRTRADLSSIIEQDVRVMDQWIEQQRLGHPDEHVRNFWSGVREDLLFRRPEPGGAR